jgi:hypothetical protein
MNEMATIKVPRAVRDRVRDAAQEEHLTQGQLIDQLLNDRRKAQFWAALEAESADDAYSTELEQTDAALIPESDQAIHTFEQGK